MKLRMRSDSVRLRLTQSEVAVFLQVGALQERLEFANGTELLYGLKMQAGLQGLAAEYRNGNVNVLVSEEEAREWASSERIGMQGQSGKLAVLVEKDFQCVHGEQNPDAFEAPAR